MGKNRIKMVETEKRKFKIKGKEVSRGEFIKSKRQEKKAKVRAFRNEHGIPEPEKKTFDLNNEKVWFKNTWKQVKVQLMNKFVKRMRSFRITLKKLEETDISALDDAKRKTIELKMRRCTNGEKLMEKEMYLIKGWHHQDIFNMLIDTPEMAFTAAVAITDKTGDMTPRARERVRAHPLIEPIMARIKRELAGFDREHGGSDEKATTVEELSEKVEQSVKVVLAAKEEEKTANKEVNRFSLDKFESLKKKTEVKESDDRVRDESEEEKEADVAETKEVEEFNEYSSDDDGEDNDSDQEPATPAENDDDDNGYDIEFVMPKFLQKETHKAESPSNSKSNSNDFFIENEADKYAQSGDEDDEKDEDNLKGMSRKRRFKPFKENNRRSKRQGWLLFGGGWQYGDGVETAKCEEQDVKNASTKPEQRQSTGAARTETNDEVGLWETHTGGRKAREEISRA